MSIIYAVPKSIILNIFWQINYAFDLSFLRGGSGIESDELQISRDLSENVI